MFRRPTFFVILLSCVACTTFSVRAQNSDEELRAAYIYNFAKYIRWPNDNPNFIIGVYGNDKNSELALQTTLKGKKIAGKDIVIKTIEDNQTIASCNILYCPDIENKELASILEQIAGKNVLLVTKE